VRVHLLMIDVQLRILSMIFILFDMAPQKNERSHDLRTLVVEHYLNGDSQREIANVLLTRATVQSIIKKYKNT
jgi:hypothetical protein